MQRKVMFYNRFCQLSHLNQGSVIIDFSTEHNLTSVYRYFFSFVQHLEVSCFKCGSFESIVLVSFIKIKSTPENVRVNILQHSKNVITGNRSIIYPFSSTYRLHTQIMWLFQLIMCEPSLQRRNHICGLNYETNALEQRTATPNLFCNPYKNTDNPHYCTTLAMHQAENANRQASVVVHVLHLCSTVRFPVRLARQACLYARFPSCSLCYLTYVKCIIYFLQPAFIFYSCRYLHTRFS